MKEETEKYKKKAINLFTLASVSLVARKLIPLRKVEQQAKQRAYIISSHICTLSSIYRGSNKTSKKNNNIIF